jgi:hypothetical protein
MQRESSTVALRKAVTVRIVHRALTDEEAHTHVRNA